MKMHLRVLALAGVAALLWLPTVGSAMSLMTQEEALKQMLPDSDKVTPENKTLTPQQIEALKKRLGGSLVLTQKGGSKEVQEKIEYTFYFGTKNGQKNGVAVIEEQPGKWGPMAMIIALDPASGKVKNLAVMSYSEKRRRPIARRNFLDQFAGKGGADPVNTAKNIRPVTGATISSEAGCFVVRKVIALYEETYLKK